MPIDPTVKKVVDRFEQRSRVGQAKYGTTLSSNNLTTVEWIQHAQEEAMDFVLYLERMKEQESKNTDDGK